MEYFIPKNVRSKFEFFRGYGFKELIVNVIISGIGGLITLIVRMVWPSPYAIFFLVLFAFIGFMFTKVDERLGESLMEALLKRMRYNKRTTLYKYRK